MKTAFFKWLGYAALALSAEHAVAQPDATADERLRLLSCDAAGTSPAAQARASAWLKQFEAPGNDNGFRIAGPLLLGKACLRNVTVTAAFGVQIVEGEICNGRLEEFTTALAAVGITLDKEAPDNARGAVLSKETTTRKYQISKGKIEPATAYTFGCSLTEGGAQ